MQLSNILRIFYGGQNMDRLINAEYIFGSILLLANKFQIWGDGIIKELTLKQWFLLMLISKMDKTNPSVREVADFSGSSRQNVKQILEQLETKGYVNINKSEKDARALTVTLTQKTFDFFVVNEEKGAEAIRALFAEITDDELELTVQTLVKLLAALGHKPMEVS
jgi:DNA-binding MarR family transcriptional regulator